MKLQSKIFYTYIAFVVVFILISLLPTPAKATIAKYHLSTLQLRLLDLTLIIPLIGIWYAVFYGYDKLQRYSQAIKLNPDGRQIAKLAQGLFVMALGVPLSSIISSGLNIIAQHHSAFTAAATIVPDYLNVLYPLIAYLFIYDGIRGLNELMRSRPSTRLVQVIGLISITIGVVFCDLISSAHHELEVAYHLSYHLVMLTLAIPYIFTWFVGLYAIAEMYDYSKHVAGILYRKGWVRMTFGLGFIIVVNIVLQYLQTLLSWVDNLPLARLLLLLYVLLFLLAGGFIVVALGTRQLMKIEEA